MLNMAVRSSFKCNLQKFVRILSIFFLYSCRPRVKELFFID